ncbi:MAG: LEA type 2 family protein [Gammaproteobacteria bacterium]|jgi:LEA14-like dessication related protein|nr:LEA type 2 family protein [Gammaproteobacteria bacterium]MDH3862445.1 LEA type 2 family protein [Gammaproteobacteria bacterium]MDH3905320.1 LEA type 2 family protein [Gammaproteobacteria bacterium]MDH3908074.1 LEA type 2 family protein [Gammaproteobacteria bacterium]MDH3953358.1 LEA type 2 family protein [Gammaproteobacteria bacterium]
MMETTRLRKFTLGAVACFAAGCASTGITVEKPGVSLRNVEVAKIDLDHQTFVLDFDVINPNPFPLPIRSVSYGVELDGFRFASGETLGEFTVPANSDSHFEITVDVDLMRTAPQLMFIVRDGIHRDIPYALEGRFAIDVPFANPVSFRNEGSIRLNAGELAAGRSD